MFGGNTRALLCDIKEEGEKMERPPFSLPGAKSVIFIYASHETIKFMEYQMGANAAVLI